MALLSLIAKLGLDKTGFEAGLNSAGKKVSQFGAGLKGQLAAAFGTAAIAAYIKSLMEYGEAINDGATKAGISKKALQEFGYAAKQNGASLDDVTKSFKALSLARQEALADPKSKAAQAFGAIGITPEELKAQSLEQLFKRIGSAIQNTDFGASELALMNELLGKAGQSLLPAFVDGLDKAEDEANRLGIVIDDAGIARLDEMGDAVERLKAELRGPASEAVIFFANTIKTWLDNAKQNFKDLANYIEGFKSGFENTDASKEKAPLWQDILGIPGGTGMRKATKKIAGGLKAGKAQLDEGIIEDEAKDISDQLLKFLEDFKFIGGKDIGARVRRKEEFEFAGKDATAKSKSLGKDKSELLPSSIPSDSLGRIGGTIGGGRNSVESELMKHTRELQKLNRRIDRGIAIQEFR